MKIFDSHCHLDDRSYAKDLNDILDRARTAGVTAMMTVGTDYNSSHKAVLLAEKYPVCYASVGIHPHDAKDCGNNVLEELRNLAGHAKVRAWGEIGLDFNRMYSPQADQEKWFIRQLEIAQEMNLPLIFHERDSNGRFFDLLRRHAKHELKGVLHCFSGSQDELDRYLAFGLFIGITGILTMKKRGRQLRQMIKSAPVDRLVVETDAPYLTPAPEKNRTRRNEPSFVRTVLLKLAEVREEDPEVMANTIWSNTCQLYEIPEEQYKSFASKKYCSDMNKSE
jgi:TatD DNase family protein